MANVNVYPECDLFPWVRRKAIELDQVTDNKRRRQVQFRVCRRLGAWDAQDFNIFLISMVAKLNHEEENLR